MSTTLLNKSARAALLAGVALIVLPAFAQTPRDAG